MKNVLVMMAGSFAISMLLALSSPADDYTIREAVDIARRVPEIPATTGDMSIREAVDRGRALSYENGVAQGYYPSAGQDYTIREAVDLFGYRAPAAWPFGYPQSPTSSFAEAYYQVPYYTAPYYVGNVRILSVEELFGTPRTKSVPVEMVETPTTQPSPREQNTPTPQPVATVAAEPAIMQPAAKQAGVIAASDILTKTRPMVSERSRAAEMSEAAPDALPELTLLDVLAYWTRKIVMTGLLLVIIGFAYHKRRTAEHNASRRIAALEDELQRLDRLIYGAEHRGGNAS